jgi:hypothetical protein
MLALTANKIRQLGDVGGDAPRLVSGQQVVGRACAAGVCPEWGH